MSNTLCAVRPLLLSLILISSTAFAGQDDEYLNGVRSDYRTIFVQKINSANTIRAKDGSLCFYRYDSDIEKLIRGSLKVKRFVFFSETKLTVGVDYLTYFSQIDAKKYRVIRNYVGAQKQKACRRAMTGYLLLYTELHRIRDAWDGKVMKPFVEFGDPLANSIPDHGGSESIRLIDFDYVKRELQK